MKVDWTKIILTMVAITIVFVLGWISKPDKQIPGSVQVRERVVRDTIPYYDTIDVYIKHKAPKIVADDSLDQVILDSVHFSISDSISGIKDQVAYDIHHRVTQDSSFWNIRLEPQLEIIHDTVVKDSIITLIEVEYKDRPALLNKYFYVAVGEAVVVVLLAIKLLL